MDDWTASVHSIARLLRLVEQHVDLLAEVPIAERPKLPIGHRYEEQRFQEDVLLLRRNTNALKRILDPLLECVPSPKSEVMVDALEAIE